MADLTISVGEPPDTLLDRAEAAERAWRAGDAKEAVPHINVESWDRLTGVLTPERLDLLRHLHREPLTPIRAAAEALGRAEAGVLADVQALTEAGLIERDRNGLRVPYEGIVVRIVL